MFYLQLQNKSHPILSISCGTRITNIICLHTLPRWKQLTLVLRLLLACFKESNNAAYNESHLMNSNTHCMFEGCQLIQYTAQ